MSANLTTAALVGNQEFGFVAEDADVVASCRGYFDRLWERTGHDLSVRTLDGWEGHISDRRASGGVESAPSLGDEGTDVGFEPAVAPVSPRVADAEQGFVKFFSHFADRRSLARRAQRRADRGGIHGCTLLCSARATSSICPPLE